MSVDLLSPDSVEFPHTARVSSVRAEGFWRLDECLQQHTHLMLGVICGTYVLLFLELLHRMVAKTSGQFVFPLDDTYITMALAKNFALHGSWSISNDTFQSATSTPGFLLLLAGLYRVTGPTVWGALLFSFSFGFLAIVLAYRMLRSVRPSVQFCALFAIVIFTPLPVLGLLGMEHTLHIALVLLFLPAVGEALAQGTNPPWKLLFLSAALVATRYEGLFMVACASLFFLGQRQIRAAFALGLAGASPLVVYGVVSVLHGCYWLPHSISLKGFASSGDLSTLRLELRNHFVTCLSGAPYLGAFIGAMLVLLWLRPVREDRAVRAALGIVFGAILLHLLLAAVGWVYRYEAYLIAASIAVIALAVSRVNILRHKFAGLALVAFAIFGFWKLAQRTWDAETSLPNRSAGIYFEHIQMARFLAGLEPGIRVAANDVGAINFFSAIRCTDLAGLADKEIFWLKRKKQYSTAALDDLAAKRHVQLVVVNPSWFNDFSPTAAGPALPRSWIRLQEWVLPYNAPLLVFYAVDPAEVPRLKQQLDSFDASLPREILVRRGRECTAAQPCM
jgi:hypothetical protein